MTCIAWDGVTLAGDRMASNGNTAVSVRKIHRIRDHLIGCAGIASQMAAFLHWFEQGAHADQFPPEILDPEMGNVGAIVITPDSQVLFFESSPYPLQILDERHAIGSGGEIALAAMAMGKTARQAVELACELTITCGRGIDTMRLGDVRA